MSSSSQQSSLLNDSHTFLLPEEFFESVNNGEFTTATAVNYVAKDNWSKNPVISTGVLLRVESKAPSTSTDKPLLLLQFVRPKVWRMRFEPTCTKPEDYNDYNSRTIISDTLTNLISILDEVEKIFWKTEFDTGNSDFYVLRTVQYPSQKDKDDGTNGVVVTEMNIFKSPFKLQIIRSVQESGTADPPKSSSEPASKTEFKRKVVWETKESGLCWKESKASPKTTRKVNATLLTTKKPGHARYVGFGEQGGKALLKKDTLMNYFNFDNMTYSSVYDQGPLDEREPLYHSEPFWLEVNGLPNYKSQVATFVDNYSQICVDFSVNSAGDIRVGTRFGPMQYYGFAGDNVADIICMYSSIIGRARLKPRYVLGHHQGCYGYDTRNKVLKVAHNYNDRDIPLDGIHIDVDLQNDYRTFTIDDKRKFPNPSGMFRELRGLGIKCATNITPVINCTEDSKVHYETLESGLKGGHFIKDKRYDDGSGVIDPHQVEYVCYEDGIKLLIDPVNEMGEFPGAEYDFVKHYNKGVEYRGGVGYGGTLGAPGFYPNLNSEETRIWWGKQYKYLFEEGLEFIWQDMTTPAIAKEYGDMKGLPFRLMMETDEWSTKDPSLELTKPALEIWALYSYNLHKATYEGLNALESRKGKRNFIIGRGSFAGAHKWAGLWTGDNASTWDHFRISVCQVLALGISANEIVGADVGGFMPAGGFSDKGPRYAEPELLIRWYCAYSMLPWFRNHYHGKRGMKLFQEPYAFTDYYNANPLMVPEKDRNLWLSVEPICRYYVKLRYSLMQLLYDTMFEHQFHGLPIARALIITDSEDTSLFVENDWVLDNEYMVRDHLLVAPVMHKEDEEGGHRKIYLPQPDNWYKFNLRIDDSLGVPLEKRIEGGSKFDVDAHIASEEAFLPQICPMFVREGGIIPQIQVRQYADDKRTPNPIHMHIYPGGRRSTYRMFLDDGVSRDSALYNGIKTEGYNNAKEGKGRWADVDLDPEAKNKYREIFVEHVWSPVTPVSRSLFSVGSASSVCKRTVTITTPHDEYNPTDIGDDVTFVLWHDPSVDVTKTMPDVQVTGATSSTCRNDIELKATVVMVPITAFTAKSKIVITATY